MACHTNRNDRRSCPAWGVAGLEYICWPLCTFAAHNVYDLGKSRGEAWQNRGVFTEISRTFIGHFYPNLAKVGKDVLSKERIV